MRTVGRDEPNVEAGIHSRQRLDLIALVEIFERTDVDVGAGRRDHAKTGDAVGQTLPRHRSDYRGGIETAAGRDRDALGAAGCRGDGDIEEFTGSLDVIFVALIGWRRVEVRRPIVPATHARVTDRHQCPAGNPLNVAVEGLPVVANVDGNELR